MKKLNQNQNKQKTVLFWLSFCGLLGASKIVGNCFLFCFCFLIHETLTAATVYTPCFDPDCWKPSRENTTVSAAILPSSVHQLRHEQGWNIWRKYQLTVWRTYKILHGPVFFFLFFFLFFSIFLLFVDKERYNMAAVPGAEIRSRMSCVFLSNLK